MYLLQMRLEKKKEKFKKWKKRKRIRRIIKKLKLLPEEITTLQYSTVQSELTSHEFNFSNYFSQYHPFFYTIDKTDLKAPENTILLKAPSHLLMNDSSFIACPLPQYSSLHSVYMQPVFIYEHPSYQALYQAIQEFK